MRIGFDANVLQSNETRGLVRYTANLLRALSGLPDLDLVLFARKPVLPEHLAGVRARVVVFDASRELMWYDWALPRRLSRERIDVFHAPADRGLPVWSPCPLVVTVHDSYERTHWRTLFPGRKRVAWYWKNELINRWCADAVLTVSDTTRETLVRLGVAPARRVHRVHLAPSEEFSAEPAAGDVATRQRYEVNAPYLLFVGGYDPRKNVVGLIEAFSRAELPDRQLVVVGLHRYGYADLVRRWRDHPCFPKLRLIEAQTADLPALYRGAELFVNPSVWESFSLPLVEAMACGTPILAARRTAIPEIAGDAAMYFDPDDPVALARLMERAAADAGLRADLRSRGFARVRQFSWRRTAEETLQVYEQVLARSRRTWRARSAAARSAATTAAVRRCPTPPASRS